VLDFGAVGLKPKAVDPRLGKAPRDVGVGVGRKGYCVFLAIDAIGRVKEDLRGTEGGDHIGRHVARPVG